jgi:transcriptional regulator with XRE-family HTH domain
MKSRDRLGETVRNRREGLGLTQRSLARKLGVEASHVAFIESGRRKPSLKLIGRLADILGSDRQNLLITAHPEARELIGESKREKPRNTSASWQRFVENHQLLARHNVTVRELGVLENLSLLGTVNSAKHFLAILMLIRDIPPNK